MTIYYIGNFQQRHCTEVHLAATLEDLGHKVIRAQENELKPDWVLDRPDGVDLVMYTRTWGGYVTDDMLKELKKLHIPTVSYHLDLYVGLSRKHLHEGKTLDEVLQTDPFWRTDFVFTPDGDPNSAEVFKRNGVNHVYMKPGVYKPECYMAHPHGEFKYDVIFVGGGDYPGSPNGYGHPEWPYRDKLIQWLRETYGDRFRKFGHPNETIRNEELNRLYADTKVVIGDSVNIGFNHDHYWSDRVYETIGRGGFLIHPYVHGLQEEFIDGEHIIFYPYDMFDLLKERIDFYLEHDHIREQIRRNGHEFVNKNATYHNRLSKMLDIVSGATAVPTPSAAPLIKINLGAGSEPQDGWVNVDWIDGKGIDVIHNLLEFPWPFESVVADEILARDVLEHMPLFNKDLQSTPIKFIEECHRLLTNGGKLFITVPHYNSPNLWIDPTHVRGYDEKSFDYFDPDKFLGQAYGYYSEKKFKVSAVVTDNMNVEFTMLAIK